MKLVAPKLGGDVDGRHYRRKGRRIGQVQLGKLIDGEACPRRGRDNVDAFVDGIRPDRFGPENAAIRLMDRQDHVDRSRLRHIPGAAWGLDGDALGVEAGFLRLADAEAGSSHSKLEGAKDRRS